MDVYARRRLVALACIIGFVILMIILISSCGSDDEPVTPATGATGADVATAPAKTQFVDQADSICAEGEALMDALNASPVAADPVEFSSQRFENARRMRRQLQNLSAPDDDAEQLETFFTALDDYVRQLRLSRGANANNDSVTLESLSVAIPAAAEQLRIASEDYGFSRCGQPADGSTVGEGEGGGEVDPFGEGGGEAPVDPPVDEAPVEPLPDDGGGDGGGDGGAGGGAGL